MRVMLSTIGSRGDVQPLVALALALRALGQDVRLCVPPDFQEGIESLGFPVTPIGPPLRPAAAPNPPGRPTPARMRELAEASVHAQFDTLLAATRGCDLLVGATALQIAAPSVAEALTIPYVFTAYCPIVLPSAHHAPPPTPGAPEPSPGVAFADLWAQNAQQVNGLFGAALNARRASLGLGAITSVRDHVLTETPWLACDPVLGPWPGDAMPGPQAGGEAVPDRVFQPGAWVVPDDRPLSPEITAFLDAGAPPVYFGLGSMRDPGGASRAMIEAARSSGRRVILSRGWAGLDPIDDAPDCLTIGEVNQQALFPRMAAVVHHGGAGTTTATALSGAPQVIVPQSYDQYYWASRVQSLGVGTGHPTAAPTAASLTAALSRALRPDVAAAASALAPAIRRDGAAVAAQHLVSVAAAA
nr:glycosyltransferase [uncultured Actinoplanes sp.]